MQPPRITSDTQMWLFYIFVLCPCHLSKLVVLAEPRKVLHTGTAMQAAHHIITCEVMQIFAHFADLLDSELLF